MWPFSKKYNLGDCGLLPGFVDWHCHVLPGVDDGVKTIEESLAFLQEYELRGVGKVWFTPHVMEDIPNSPQQLRECFEMLKERYKGKLELRLAAENMLDALLDQRIAAGDVLPIGDRKDHLLVETSYFTAPLDMDDKLQRVRSAGLFPLLAHPERYNYMEMADYDRLHDDGIKFQLNLYSIFGMYGSVAKAKAKDLLKMGYYSVIGTDTHRFGQLQYAIGCRSLSQNEIAALRSLPGI